MNEKILIILAVFIIAGGLIVGHFAGYVYPPSGDIQIAATGSEMNPWAWQVLSGDQVDTEFGYFFLSDAEYQNVKDDIEWIGNFDTGEQISPIPLKLHQITQGELPLGTVLSWRLENIKSASLSSGYGSNSFKWHGDIREEERERVWGSKRFNIYAPDRTNNEIGWLVYYRCDGTWWSLSSQRFACDIYQERVRIYEEDCVGINLLNYIESNNDKLDFLNKFGDGEVCKTKSNVEYGKICESTTDCIGTTINYDLHNIEGATLYFTEFSRCEKGEPSDLAIEFVNSKVAGRFGTCEKGAKTVSDCTAVLGSSADYKGVTADGRFYQGFSGWGVKDGICWLGSCRDDGGCFNLYNSVSYECVPKYMDAQAQNFYGICEWKEITAGMIAEKCDKLAAEGKIEPLKQNYRWTDIHCTQEEGSGLVSECTTASDCDCSAGEVARCIKIDIGDGTVIGRCDCDPEPGPQPTTSISNGNGNGENGGAWLDENWWVVMLPIIMFLILGGLIIIVGVILATKE